MRIRPHESDPKPFRVLKLSTYTVSAVVQGLDDGAPTLLVTLPDAKSPPRGSQPLSNRYDAVFIGRLPETF